LEEILFFVKISFPPYHQPAPMKDIDDVIIPSFELTFETIIDYHGLPGDVDFKY
jgi:hypothetical protein